MTTKTTSPHTVTLTKPSDLEVSVSRLFDAPRELVYRAHTDPELIPRWWGSRKNETTVDKLDVRPGGQWRFIQHMPDGSELAFGGEFREVVPPERLVQTWEDEAYPGSGFLVTITFEDQDGKTLLTNTSRFGSKEARDGTLEYGMEKGAAAAWKQLEKVLAEL